jgi:hypothetical protein
MSGYTFAQVVQLSLIDLWGRVVAVLPDLIGALIIILVGFIVAPILGGIVKKLVDILKIDELSAKMGLKDMMKGYAPNFSVSLILGKLVKWFFILAFIMAAADVLGWSRVSVFLNEIIFYIPQVLIAVVILVFGAIAGSFFDSIVTKSLQGSNTPIARPELMGQITRWALILFAALAALLQLGIAPSLIQILFAGIVLALALAFGLGGQKKAGELLEAIAPKRKAKK